MSNHGSLYHWAQLVRFPNTFTVLADVGAAFFLVAHSPYPIGRFVGVLLAGVCFYWAGMVLNDVWDIEKDRLERPGRPLPAGNISLHAAQRAGWGFLFAGLVLASASGFIPAEGFMTTWRSAWVGLALALAILLYDGPLKTTAAGPAAMGMCRFFSFLLGASPLVEVLRPEIGFPVYLWVFAAGFGSYVMGITVAARTEATSSRPLVLLLGIAIMLLGALMIGFAPQVAPLALPWKISITTQFPLLIGLVSIVVLLRGMRALQNPQPVNVQRLIRVSILTIIPLAASVALLGAGVVWACGIYVLMIPAIFLAGRLRVT